MGLRQILGRMPGGMRMDLSWDAVTAFLRARYLCMPGSQMTGTATEDGRHLRDVYTTDPTDGEAVIRANMRQRLDLYRGKGRRIYETMIDKLFAHPENREQRRAMLPFADWQNAVKRIIDELSTVYSAPATRTIAGDVSAYGDNLDALEWDATMDLACHLANLCNACLLWLRPQTVGGEVRPRLDIITRDCFAPIADPLDPRAMVGVVLDCWPDGPSAKDTDPHYQVWTDDEIFALDRGGRLVVGSVEPNPYGMLPGMLLRSSIPISGLMEYDAGGDIVAAHLAAVFLNLVMLAGQRVGTKQPYAMGDLSSVPRGQRMGTETLLELGREGIQVGVLDLGIDPAAAIASARSVIAQVAANYGIPEDAFTMTGSSVGPAQAEKRQATKERRLKQVKVYRTAERRMATILSRWIEVSGPRAWSFSPDGFAIDFVEVATPMSPTEQQQWRKEQRHLGLRSPVDDMMDENPDLDREAARTRLEEVAQELATWLKMYRALNIRTDVTAENPGDTPQENGAKGGRPPNGKGDMPPEDMPMEDA